ncbi:La-related protein 6 isoform 1 [Quillaja saponaria]|uniref:La-related protein 6 isoform 1 n=1 Tax=Quillaja saponaria TaxID=32244 RepID=A0AAD7VKX3_QUISA|nr:La-related protein 6 isoform 1 [Quillaja saponaria]
MTSVASSRQSFLTNTLTPLTHKPQIKIISSVKTLSCKQPESNKEESVRKNENKLAKLAIVTLAAGVLTLGSAHDASAAKSGGRVGGQAFKSSAPRSSSPRVKNNSRTNIYINPPVAPPLVGGYGYGYGFGVPFYGGWGWSPFSFFAPGPSVAVGIGGGFELIALFMFLGAAAVVVRRFTGSRDEEDDDY